MEELGARINQKHEEELDEMHVEYQSEVDRLSQEVYERGIVVCYDRFVRKAFGNGESIACMGAAADHIGHGVGAETTKLCSKLVEAEERLATLEKRAEVKAMKLWEEVLLSWALMEQRMVEVEDLTQQLVYVQEEGKAALEELGAQLSREHEELDEMHAEYQSEADRLNQEAYEKGIAVCYDRYVRKAFGRGESAACAGAAVDHSEVAGG